VVETSTCCPNTATEHAMMERLMIDSVLTWATEYKVDGFRFDLMGHHPKAQMERLRAALDALTLEETASTARRSCSTARAGTSARSPTTPASSRPPRRTWPAPASARSTTGCVTRPAAATPSAARRGGRVLRRPGRLRRASRKTTSSTSPSTTTRRCGTSPSTSCPTTCRPRRACARTWSRCRRCCTRRACRSCHAGSDLLRSKSFDRNSYDAGDWFNAIDWTGDTTGFGRGVPLAADNRDSWSLMRPRLENPLLQPTPADVAFAAEATRDMLRLRRASPLFRLRTAEDIAARLTFHHTGPEATPGVIVFELRDDLSSVADLDPAVDRLLVVINASPDRVNLSVPGADRPWLVHPLLAEGADAPTLHGAAVYAATTVEPRVPALTSVVFVAPATATVTGAGAVPAGSGVRHPALPRRGWRRSSRRASTVDVHPVTTRCPRPLAGAGRPAPARCWCS
jgi:hypothetical protein